MVNLTLWGFGCLVFNSSLGFFLFSDCPLREKKSWCVHAASSLNFLRTLIKKKSLWFLGPCLFPPGSFVCLFIWFLSFSQGLRWTQLIGKPGGWVRRSSWGWGGWVRSHPFILESPRACIFWEDPFFARSVETSREAVLFVSVSPVRPTAEGVSGPQGLRLRFSLSFCF